MFYVGQPWWRAAVFRKASFSILERYLFKAYREIKIFVGYKPNHKEVNNGLSRYC